MITAKMEAGMKLYLKHMVSAVALCAMTLGMTTSGFAMADKRPVRTVKDRPPPAQGDSVAPTETPVQSGTTAERGIKDNGVKQCGKCGVTSGRVKAPDGTEGAEGTSNTPPSTERGHKDNTVPGGGTGKR